MTVPFIDGYADKHFLAAVQRRAIAQKATDSQGDSVSDQPFDVIVFEHDHPRLRTYLTWRPLVGTEGMYGPYAEYPSITDRRPRGSAANWRSLGLTGQLLTWDILSLQAHEVYFARRGDVHEMSVTLREGQDFDLLEPRIMKDLGDRLFIDQLQISAGGDYPETELTSDIFTRQPSTSDSDFCPPHDYGHRSLIPDKDRLLSEEERERWGNP